MDYKKKYLKYKQKYLKMIAGDFNCVSQNDINAGYNFSDIPWCQQPGYGRCENIGLVPYGNPHMNVNQPVRPCYQAPVASPRVSNKLRPSIEPGGNYR